MFKSLVKKGVNPTLLKAANLSESEMEYFIFLIESEGFSSGDIDLEVAAELDSNKVSEIGGSGELIVDSVTYMENNTNPWANADLFDTSDW